MAVMMGNLYAALIRAGADAVDAQKAAEEVADHESRIADLRNDMTDLKGDLKLIRWMLGFNLAMTLAVVGKLFLAR